ncbi:MAG: hydrogenase maturation protease [Nitrospirales bacterium]|nr:hydrogenase maturation protease [Nitrospirales bacterium]
MNTKRVIGLGNLYAGDDAVGILVIRKLQALHLPGVDMIEAGLAGLTLLDLLEGAKHAIVVDAVQSDLEEGAIIRLEIPQDQDQVTRLSWDSATPSTHSIGLSEAITLGMTLGILPEQLTIIGIELAHCTTNQPISRKVFAATETVLASIVEDLRKMACTNSN